MSRHRCLVFLSAGLALAALWAQPGSTRGADPPVTIEAAALDDGTWRLTSSVTASDGRALSQTAVTFTAATEFFGERWVPIGTAVTDTSGTASLVYRPTWNGAQTLVARTSGTDGPQTSEPITIEVTGALPGIAQEREDLPIVRAWALPIGVGVVVAVWVVLAFLFLSAVIGIARRPKHAQAIQGPPGVDARHPVESTADGGSRT